MPKRKNRIIISREPGSDIRVHAQSTGEVNALMDFTLTHIPTGLTVCGQGKSWGATVKRLRSQLLADVEAHEQKKERRVPLTTSDLRPFRAVSDKLASLLTKTLTISDYEPTITELNELSNAAAVMSAHIRSKVAIFEAQTEPVT